MTDDKRIEGAAKAAVDKIFYDIRDRRGLKWLFGEGSEAISADIQKEIHETWQKYIRETFADQNAIENVHDFQIKKVWRDQNPKPVAGDEFSAAQFEDWVRGINGILTLESAARWAWNAARAAEAERVRKLKDALNLVDCNCSVDQRLSGHSTGCFMPEFLEACGEVDSKEFEGRG